MKVLYLSGYHPVLEYDECLILEELGYHWFSTGVYLDPDSPLNYPHLNLRNPIPTCIPEFMAEMKEEFLSYNPGYVSKFSGMNRPNTKLTKEFVDNFDIVFATQINAIKDNWEVLKHKPVIWRTVGGVKPEWEVQMKPFVDSGNIHPVRFSEVEFETPINNGGIAIRNYVDEDVYKGWEGTDLSVLTFQSWFAQRRSLKNVQAYLKYRKSCNHRCRLFGASVYKDPIVEGTPTWTQQIDLYKKSRAYFYIGSNIPAPTYNFLEAMMTGIPIITLGPKSGGIQSPKTGEYLHEVSSFMSESDCGACSDNIQELLEYTDSLFNSPSYAKEVSKNCRNTALKYFSKQVAKSRWKELLESLK